MRPERRPRRPTLAQAQRALLSFITGGPGGRPWSADALIAGDGRASADARVAVYAHMYRARLAEALASQFPRLARALGPGAFDRLSARYADAHPSRHPSLRFLGQHLPGWIESHGEGSAADVGLARLEWARSDVFDLVDEPTLTTDAARAWAPDRFDELPLRLITAHRLVTVAAGTADRWDALGPDAAEPIGAASVRPSRAEAPESLVVWREGTAVYHRVVGDDERRALEGAVTGTWFGPLCEGLLAHHDEGTAVARAFEWLSSWLADGLLRAV